MALLITGISMIPEAGPQAGRTMQLHAAVEVKPEGKAEPAGV